jgi:hypothetical protein
MLTVLSHIQTSNNVCSTSAHPSAVWKAIDSGGTSSCGIIAVNDSVACWGGTPDTLPGSLALGQLAWKAVSVGGLHACGILLNDTVRCAVTYHSIMLRWASN